MSREPSALRKFKTLRSGSFMIWRSLTMAPEKKSVILGEKRCHLVPQKNYWHCSQQRDERCSFQQGSSIKVRLRRNVAFRFIFLGDKTELYFTKCVALMATMVQYLLHLKKTLHVDLFSAQELLIVVLHHACVKLQLRERKYPNWGTNWLPWFSRCLAR